MMEGEQGTKAIDKLLANLNRIPREIKSEVVITNVVKAVEDKLKKDLRRYNSYV